MPALSSEKDFPDLLAEIEFVPPAWTDVSAYLKRFSTRRGRGEELERAQTGTARLRLANHDRRFDPLHTAGPYYPNVLPFRRVRLSAIWPPAIAGGAQTTYRLFTGYIERWPQVWVGSTQSYVEVEAVDAFELLAASDLVNTGAWPQERTGARIVRMLDAIGWPAADRSIATGISDIAASGDYVDAADVLPEMHAVAETELGFLFVDGQGRIVFQDRHRRIKNNSIVQATFGDAAPAGGELPYVDLVPAYEGAFIRNDITVDRPGGVLQRAQDAASIVLTKVPRSLARTPRLTSDTEALDMARYLLSRYKDPEFRFTAIKLEPRMDTLLWPQALGREPGDRIRTIRRSLGIGAAIDREVHIEAAAHDVTARPLKWFTTFALSSADVQAYWMLDSAANSVLGTSTRLAY